MVNRVKITDPDDRGDRVRTGAGTRHRDRTADGLTERTAGLELPADDDLASIGQIASSWLEASVHGRAHAFFRRLGAHARPAQRRGLGRRPFDATSSQLFVEPDRIAGSILLVDGLQRDIQRGGDVTTTVLRMTDGPADAELLGWIGPRHALAVLDDNFDDKTADLVLLSLDVEAGEAEGPWSGR